MASGKLSGKSLRENVLNLIGQRRKEVLVGANYGGDCATLFGDGAFCVHTDPITVATEEIGSLAVKVVLNDISAGFGEPVALLLTLLMPKSMDESDVKRIISDAEAEAKNWNAEIIGGHTEFTDAVNCPIVNAVGIGIRPLSYKHYAPKVGDDVIVTKMIALEGTFILAERHKEKLNLSESEIGEIKDYAKKTSVMTEAKIVRESGLNALMHDITEGGVLGALAELSDISGIGIEVNVPSIPVSELSKKICGSLGVNPYKLISSGSMLIVTDKGEELSALIEKSGVPARVIGKITEGVGAVAVDEEGNKQKLIAEADELYRKIGE